MKLQHNTRNVSSVGVLETSNFTIKQDAKNFVLWSRTLYSRPEEAVLRELCQNAYDSHKLAGNSDPIIVQLPTVDTPVLRVTDNGVGMSHKFVMDRYTSYGESTKENTNDQVGGLGYGGKTPLAISDSFVLIVRYDGVCRTYATMLDDDGVPQMNLIGESDTDEVNGVTVEVPVAQENILPMRGSCSRVFEMYETKPTFIGDQPKLKTEDHEVILSNPEFTFYGNVPREAPAVSQHRVIMEIVSYPLDLDNLGLDKKYMEFLSNARIDFHRKVGATEIAPSRENLVYNRRSSRHLKAMVERAVDTIIEHFTEQVQQIDNLFEARLEYQNIRRIIPALPQETTLSNGNKVVPVIKYDKGNAIRPGTSLIFTEEELSRLDRSKTRFPNGDRNNFFFAYNSYNDYVFIIDDLTKCYKKRTRIYNELRRRNKTSDRCKVITIRPEDYFPIDTSPDDVYEKLMLWAKEFFDTLGNPPASRIIRLSETQEVARPSYQSAPRGPSGSRASVKGIRKYVPQKFYHHGSVRTNKDVLSISEEVTFDDENPIPEKALYIPLMRGIPVETSTGPANMYRTTPRLNSASIIVDNKYPIYFVPNKLLGTLPKGWMPLDKHVMKIVRLHKVEEYNRLSALSNAPGADSFFNLPAPRDKRNIPLSESNQKKIYSYLKRGNDSPIFELYKMCCEAKTFVHDNKVEEVMNLLDESEKTRLKLAKTETIKYFSNLREKVRDQDVFENDSLEVIHFLLFSYEGTQMIASYPKIVDKLLKHV